MLSEKAKAIMEEQKRDLRKGYEESLQHPYIQELIKSGEWDKMSSIGQRGLLLDLYPCPPIVSELCQKSYEEGVLRADIMRAERAAEEKRRSRGK
jgi:hypothetical protein